LAASPCPSLFPWASFPVVFVAALFLSLAVAHCAPLAVPLAPDVALAVRSAASQCDPLADPQADCSAAHLADDHS
jgi:hypothetical protein